MSGGRAVSGLAGRLRACVGLLYWHPHFETAAAAAAPPPFGDGKLPRRVSGNVVNGGEEIANAFARDGSQDATRQAGGRTTENAQRWNYVVVECDSVVVSGAHLTQNVGR